MGCIAYDAMVKRMLELMYSRILLTVMGRRRL